MTANHPFLTITLIAAVADNGVIGRDGQLPWRLPGDLKHFKSRTMGCPVVMGRRTWETLDAPLPGRTNIVLTRSPDYVAEGAQIVHDISDAISLASAHATECAHHEVFIAGGGEIYALALPHADVMDLTLVHAEVPGDARFPEFDESQWEIEREESHPADDRHSHPYTFRRLVRRES